MRTVAVQAETEHGRDLWVEVIKLALMRRQVVREAVRVAAERLDVDSPEWGETLSLPEIVQDLVENDASRTNQDAPGARVHVFVCIQTRGWIHVCGCV